MSGVTIEDLQPPSNRRSQWRRLPELTLGAVRLVWTAGRRSLLLTTVLQLIAAVATGAQLLTARRLLEQLIAVSEHHQRASTLLVAFAALVGATALLGAMNALTQQQQRLLSELVSRHAFGEIINVSAAVDYAAFETPAFYDQLERAKASGMYRPIDMVGSVTNLLMAVATSLGIALVLAKISVLLLPLVLVAGIPLLLSTLRNSKQAYQFEYALTPQSRERYYLMQLLTERDTAKELRVFGATRYLKQRYDALTEERMVQLRIFLRKRLFVGLTGTMGTAMGTGLALGALGLLLTDGRISVASAVTAGLAMQLLSSRINTITASLGKLVESGMFLDDYRRFLRVGHAHKPPDAAERRPVRTAVAFDGLRLEDVRFQYPTTDRTVLEDIDLEIGPGEVVALVGENGSGKTTLVKLISQLYRPTAGRIVWNGLDAAEVDAELLRANMTVLFQDYIRYHLSARDNIALGDTERRDEVDAILAAARRGGADGFIDRLPHGIETRLGRQFEGGHELSIGQWQRLALARAFFRGGDFLILDEPTASLDPRAEHALFEQMRELAAGRSVLLVSHRFSSVRSADRIYVLQGGRIIERGTHAELMALSGHYAELFALQANAYLGPDPTPLPA